MGNPGPTGPGEPLPPPPGMRYGVVGATGVKLRLSIPVLGVNMCPQGCRSERSGRRQQQSRLPLDG
eukprot:3767318-Prorocentrum_lima.AAC.1